MSEAESHEERKGTRVTFLDQTGAKSVDAVIADTVSVKRILPNIITKMNLPVMGPDGQPMSYSLDHKEGGNRLHEEQTLVARLVGFDDGGPGGMEAGGDCDGACGDPAGATDDAAMSLSDDELST